MTDVISACRADRPVAVALFYAIFLLFHLYTQVERLNNVPIPNEYDELQHVSFAISQKLFPAVFQEYENLWLIDLEHPAEFTTEPNYLNHPPVYYSFLGLFVSGETSETIFRRLRLVNLGLSTLALSLLFSFGMLNLKAPREHLAFGLVGVMNPTIAALGGQVTNDNMAFLGGVIALMGLTRLAQGRITASSAGIIGIGFAVAALAKLTAGLLVGVCVLAVHGLMFDAFREFDRSRLRYMTILGVLTVAGVLPYLHNLLIYHAPLYVDLSGLDKGGIRLDFQEFLTWFAYIIPATWSVFPPADPVQIVTLALLLGLAGFGVRHHLSPAGGRRRELAIVTAASAVAVAVVLPVHFAFSYDLHAETGHHGGVHIRYYLPLWGAAMIGSALGLAAIGSEVRRAAAFILLAVLMTYSNLVSARQSGFSDIYDRICLSVPGCETR